MKNFDDNENSFFDAIIYSIIFYKPEGKIIDRDQKRSYLEMIFTMIYLKVRMILSLIGQFLDILTDGFKLMMSVTGIVFSLNVFSKEICLGLL